MLEKRVINEELLINFMDNDWETGDNEEQLINFMDN